MRSEKSAGGCATKKSEHSPFLGGRYWHSPLLAEMGVLRYSTLRKEMSNISDAVLAVTLKEL